MIDRDQVHWDVSLSIRAMVIDWTMINKNNYHTGLIPSAEPTGEPPEGWGSNIQNWSQVMLRIEADLHRKDDRYKAFIAKWPDIEETLDISLAKSATYLTDRVLEEIGQFLPKSRRRRTG